MGAIILSLVAGIASLLLALLAIGLSLYHKQEADKTNAATRDLLSQIRAATEMIGTVAMPEGGAEPMAPVGPNPLRLTEKRSR